MMGQQIRLVMPHFDPAQIASSGQCFRWEQTAQDAWLVRALFAKTGVNTEAGVNAEAGANAEVWLDRSVQLQQVGTHEFTMGCTEEQYRQFWKHYFDCGTDYDAMETEGHGFRDPFLEQAMAAQSGMRILRQSLWEVMVSFIISQNNNIPRIRGSITKLCCAQGCFPTPQEILQLKLETCGLGYRDSYLRAAAKWILQGGAAGPVFRPDKNGELQQGEKAGEKLREIEGVGPKVEACIRLYGLHDLSCCPMDTWMKRIVKEDYQGVRPAWMDSRHAGYFQQVSFAYKRMQAAAGKS